MEREIDDEQIKSIEETVLRLHCYLRRLAQDNMPAFRQALGKLEKPKWSVFSRKDKEAISLWAEHYKYYEGKMMAYMVALESFGYPEVPQLIQRLRGMEFNEKENKAYQKPGAKILEDIGP